MGPIVLRDESEDADSCPTSSTLAGELTLHPMASVVRDSFVRSTPLSAGSVFFQVSDGENARTLHKRQRTLQNFPAVHEVTESRTGGCATFLLTLSTFCAMSC